MLSMFSYDAFSVFHSVSQSVTGVTVFLFEPKTQKYSFVRRMYGCLFVFDCFYTNSYCVLVYFFCLFPYLLFPSLLWTVCKKGRNYKECKTSSKYHTENILNNQKRQVAKKATINIQFQHDTILCLKTLFSNFIQEIYVLN